MTDKTCHFFDVLSARKMLTPSIWNVFTNDSRNSLAGNSHEIDGDTRKDTIITKTGDNMIPDALTGYQPKLNDACH